MEPEAITPLLRRWSAGDEAAAREVFDRLYGELHNLAAAAFRRERGDHTLQPTAVVHEAYLRLSGGDVDLDNRVHFLGAAAHAMRRVLVEHSRRRNRVKRGGHRERVSLEAAEPNEEPREVDVLALDRALEELGKLDPEKARMVEARYFGGLTIAEISRLVGVSTATVERRLRRAKAWLFSRLGGDLEPPPAN